MAYKALYRSYRPQTFNEVAGQEHIITTLKNAINQNKIAHAYLFAGPRGTGKTTVAKILAKALNCLEDDVPCDNCENCKSISEGQHPDVIEIDAASNNGVDEVRDLIDKVKYAPINGKYKVYIIDEVHMMSTGAFNALLKTLEEPPAHIIFILATTEPHKILPTIISRCQRFDFKKVEDKDIIKRLEIVLKSENMQYQVDALELISKLAEGGMRDALSILEQCLAYNNNLTIDSVNSVYGLLSMDHKISFIKKILSKDIKSVLELLEDMISGSIDIKRLTFDLIDVLKDIIIYKNTNDLNILFVLTKKDIDNICPYILVEEAFDLIDKLVEASNHYNQSLNASIYFELAILKMCNNVKEENKIIAEESIILGQEIINEEFNHEDLIIEEKEDSQIDQEIEIIEEINSEPMIIESNQEVDSIEESSNNQEAEESNQMMVPTDDIEVTLDDILNILVQADRNILNEVKEKWQVISRYRYNLNTAKMASILCDGIPVAAAKDGIIITFDHQPLVNSVNYSDNYHYLKLFLKEVMGKDFDFIAIKSNEWSSIRETYINLNREGRLPEPKKIVLHHINEFKEKKAVLNDAQQFAVDMFGETLVEIKE